MTIDQVILDQPTKASYLRLNGDLPLPEYRYRLLVCGSTSIVDLQDNSLDGDGDGISGGNHLQDFRVVAEHLLLNFNFDDDLSSWTLSSSLPPEINYSLDDGSGAPTCGSAEIVNLTGPGEFFVLSSACRSSKRNATASVAGCELPMAAPMIPRSSRGRILYRG